MIALCQKLCCFLFLLRLSLNKIKKYFIHLIKLDLYMRKISFSFCIAFLQIFMSLLSLYVVAKDIEDHPENITALGKSSNTGITTFVNVPIDYFSNLRGVIKIEDSYMLNASLGFGLDLETLTELRGTLVYLSCLGIKGMPFLENTGAIQGISNIAGLNQFKLYEAWIEQKFLDDNFSILFGLYDLNSEFDVRESSGIFINPSFGIGFDFSQSGLNGPSVFPYTSLALRIKARLSDSFEIIGAVFDGVPGSIDNDKSFQIKLSAEEGALISTELIYASQQNQTTLSIGGWYYTANFERDVGSSKPNSNFGLYFSGEKIIYNEEINSHQGLCLFGRIGFAHSNFNSSDYSLLGGINYTGLIPGRDEDTFGLAFTSIHLTDTFKQLQNLNSNFETIVELTYSIQIIEWFRLQPDLQYIFHPVFSQEAEYAFVAGIRTEISF